MPVTGGVDLLELHDALDRLDEEIRIRRMVLVFTPLIAVALAVPVLAVLFVNGVGLFPVYPAAFVAVLGAILWAVTRERRRLRDEQEAIRDRIRRIEVAA